MTSEELLDRTTRLQNYHDNAVILSNTHLRLLAFL